MSRGLGEVGIVVEHLPAMLEDTGSIPLYTAAFPFCFSVNSPRDFAFVC